MGAVVFANLCTPFYAKTPIIERCIVRLEELTIYAVLVYIILLDLQHPLNGICML